MCGIGAVRRRNQTERILNKRYAIMAKTNSNSTTQNDEENTPSTHEQHEHLALHHKPNDENYDDADIYFMKYVLKIAQGAYDNGEVPIGAIVVVGGNIVGEGENRKETLQDTVAHAEILAIQNASKTLGSWRLNNATLYTNVEPCIMCCGAILHSRVNRVVFCAAEPKFGGVVSQANLLDIPTLNHQVEYQYGLMAEQSQQLIRRFFREIRAKAQKRRLNSK